MCSSRLKWEFGLRLLELSPTLQCKQKALRIEATGEPRQRAIATYGAMARHND